MNKKDFEGIIKKLNKVSLTKSQKATLMFYIQSAQEEAASGRVGNHISAEKEEEIDYLIDNTDLSDAKIAKAMGVSRTTVGRHRKKIKEQKDKERDEKNKERDKKNKSWLDDMELPFGD